MSDDLKIAVAPEPVPEKLTAAIEAVVAAHQLGSLSKPDDPVRIEQIDGRWCLTIVALPQLKGCDDTLPLACEELFAEMEEWVCETDPCVDSDGNLIETKNFVAFRDWFAAHRPALEEMAKRGDPASIRRRIPSRHGRRRPRRKP